MGRSSGGTVSFAKLGEQTLWTYMGAHDITPCTSDIPSRNDLATACKQHFSSWKVDEDALLERLVESPRGMGFNREIGRNGRNNTRITLYRDAGMASPRTSQMENAEFNEDGRPLLKIGEMVAAKVSGSDDNWILACISRRFYQQGQYEVMDEDDSRHTYVVESCNALQLSDSVKELQKGDSVIAMFPETTSFYPAKIAKNPKRNALDVYVYFEDDEDEVGKTPTRRIMSKYVIPVQDTWAANTKDGA
eukprot:238043_1